MSTILTTKDTNWVRQSFLLPESSIDEIDAIRRVYTEASLKFTDTTLGGNTVINPPPQFTRWADLKQGRKVKGSKGMGRYYSEAFDDNNQVVHMRFGVPEFNSMTTFFTNFYDADLGKLAGTGRTGGLLFNLGKIFGYAIGWPIQILITVGSAVRFMLNMPSSKYYYLKPTMPLYWNAVNGMLNEIAVGLGLIAPLVKSSYDSTKMAELTNGKITEKTKSLLTKALPDVFRGDGGIDIYAVATRAQRLSQQWDKLLVEAMEKSKSMEDLKSRFSELAGHDLELKKNRSIVDYLNDYFQTSAAATTDSTADKKTDAVGETEMYGSWFEKGADFLEAELRDGAQFVSFRVDSTGASSESFSNSTRESDLSSTINSTSSGARNARFNFAGGNVGDGPLATLVESAVGAVTSVATGLAKGVGIQGLCALAGSAFVDIPKHWDSSTVSLPRADFTIQLRTPYGNDLSRFMNLYVPLCMLLAGAMPLATGNASYRSPFLVELYCRGRNQIRLGMIDSMSISRGVGNLGFNRDGKPLGIDITFSVVDMSSIMYMPISPGFSPLDMVADLDKVRATLFAEDSAYHDYMAVLSSQSLSSQIYQIPKFFRNLTMMGADFNSWASASHMASWVGGTPPGRLFSAVLKGKDQI